MNGGAAARPPVPGEDARPSPPANGKPAATQLNINRESRKPLFAHTASKENSTKSQCRHANCKVSPNPPKPRRPSSARVARPGSSMSMASMASDRSSVSSTPGGSARSLPRSNTTGHMRDRSLFTIADAYRLAEKEEDDKDRFGSPGGIDASPSPAPRPWRRDTLDDSAKQSHLARETPSRGLKSRKSLPSSIPRRPGSSASQSSPSAASVSAGRRMSDLGKKSPSASLFSKSRIGPKLTKTGDVLARKASNSSLDGRPTSPAPTRLPRSKTTPGRTKPAGKENDLPGVAQPKAEPNDLAPAPELNQAPRLSSSWEIVENNASPDKSYAWQVDDEFTAGDLQVSDSPRIRFDADINKAMRPMNTKLDEIMERETQQFKDYPLPEGPRPRPFNTRLDEIEELENQIDDYAKSDQYRPKNTKLDEIWALEKDILSSSRKALAASKLEEIKRINSQPRPRSASPVAYRHSSGVSREPTRYYDAESSEGDDWVEGERIPHTPVTLFRKTRETRPMNNMRLRATSDTEDYGAGDRPRDVLRRLARAASTSPEVDAPNSRSDSQRQLPHAANSNANSEPAPPPPVNLHDEPQNNPPTKEKPQIGGLAKTNGKNGKNLNSKPSVGFAGLRRVASAESTRSKKSIMTNSDSDPTERIEREMQLFAPGDNQSDRGSLRVPSPAPDALNNEEKNKATDNGKIAKEGDQREKNPIPEDGDLEETPRANRQQNILAMPTPKITGAYVETPATVKVEPLSVDLEKLPAVSATVPDKTDVVRRRRSYSTSDKGESDEGSRARDRSRRSHRRSRSLPKRRQPLLNTANPPTVRDDLMELQRTHNIEDSTLDDFSDLMAHKDVPESPEIDEMLEDMTDQFIEEVAKEKKRKGTWSMETEREAEMEAIARMTKSLQTGLLGIRSAKQGIERLEDQVSHADPELLQRAKETVEKKMRKEIKEEATEEVQPAIETQAEVKDEPKLPKEVKSEEATLVKPEVKQRKPTKPLSDTKRERIVIERVEAPAVNMEQSQISIPLPRLYRRSPMRLTLFGILAIAAALWCAAESVVCLQYCRPTTCTDGPCVWSLDDPTFGYAIPHKLDEWTTGGQARGLTARLTEGLSDFSADALDYIRGTDIRDVSIEDLDFEDRRRHRRRLKKKGYTTKRVEPAEHRDKWDAWRTERAAKERASAAREMGYHDYGESESMSDDVRV